MDIFEFLNSPIVGTIVAAIIAGIGWLGKKLWDRREKQRAEKAELDAQAEAQKAADDHKERMDQKDKAYTANMRAIAAVYSSMEAIQEIPQVTRVFLLEVSNGGGSPVPGSVVYGRGIHIRHVDHAQAEMMLARYEAVRLDSTYIDMVLQVKAGAEYKILVKDYQACILKDFYTEEGIYYSEVYHIYTDLYYDKTFIMSVATTQEGETFQDEQVQAAIRTNLMVIKQNFDAFRPRKVNSVLTNPDSAIGFGE